MSSVARKSANAAMPSSPSLFAAYCGYRLVVAVRAANLPDMSSATTFTDVAARHLSSSRTPTTVIALQLKSTLSPVGDSSCILVTLFSVYIWQRERLRRGKKFSCVRLRGELTD